MKRSAREFLVFSLVLLSNLSGTHPCIAAVTLQNDIEVSRPTVKLSDVFHGLPDGIDQDIARAPAPGKSIIYDNNVLTKLSQQYKLNWQPLNSSDHATVTTLGVHLTGDDIRAVVAEKIKSLGIKGDIDVAFDNHSLGIDMPVDRAHNFSLNNFEYDTVNKRFHAELMADAFAGPLNLPLTGHISVRHKVPVLSKRLEAGTTVSAADIDWLSVPDDRMGGIVTNPEQLVGRELRRDTDSQQPISEHDIIPPRLVVRGTLITMRIETPFMMVTAQGRALQDGKRGDIVRITNTQSNRMVEGTVEGAGLVRIPLAQKIVAADSSGGKQE